MDEEIFNKSIRGFLKKVGITSQREIEKAARELIDEGRLKGSESLPATVVLRVPELDLEIEIEDTLRLE